MASKKKTPPAPVPSTIIGEGKRILIIGYETEVAYFEGIKNNPILKDWTQSVTVLNISKEHTQELIGMIIKAMQEKDNYDEIWIVVDNDKGNAYIVDDTFSVKIKDSCIEAEVKTTLLAAFFPLEINKKGEKLPKYFLSLRDFVSKIEQILGCEDTLKYIEVLISAANKNTDFEKFENKNPFALFQNYFFENKKTKQFQYEPAKFKGFDSDWKSYTKLAYSCIAFEYWLLLHFEQNKIPFTLIDKIEDESKDVMTYLKNHYRPNYVKGYKKGKENAYEILKDTANDNSFVQHQAAIERMITAIQNTQWLKNEMQSELALMGNCWFKVNPYLKGLDELLSDLLNIKSFGKEILYYQDKIQISISSDDNKINIHFELILEGNEILNNLHKEYFYLTYYGDTPQNRIYPSEIHTIQIKANEKSAFSLSFSKSSIPQNAKNLRFVYKFSFYKNMREWIFLL